MASHTLSARPASHRICQRIFQDYWNIDFELGRLEGTSMSLQVFRSLRLQQGRHGGQATLCANAAGIGEILFAQVLLGVLIPAPGTSTSPFVFFDGGKTRPMNSENGQHFLRPRHGGCVSLQGFGQYLLLSKNSYHASPTHLRQTLARQRQPLPHLKSGSSGRCPTQVYWRSRRLVTFQASYHHLGTRWGAFWVEPVP